MSEPESAYQRLHRAEHELGEKDQYVVQPVEETDEAAAAVEDDVPLASLRPKTKEPVPPGHEQQRGDRAAPTE